MRIFITLLILIISGVLFALFINPTYTRIQGLSEEIANLDRALGNSRLIQEKRDSIVARRNSFRPDDINRLEKMVPNNVDNVRLVRDLDAIAARYGMGLRGVAVSVFEERDATNVGTNTRLYDTVNLSFSVSGSYKTFLAFLRDLERSLRIIDVTSISFSAGDRDLYEYRMTVKTYWLK